jgi:hypothetical protein
MRVLVDGASGPRWGRVEQVVEFVCERVRSRPPEGVGDHDAVFASSELDGPDASGGSAVGADVGMVDLDDDVSPTWRPVA